MQSTQNLVAHCSVSLFERLVWNYKQLHRIELLATDLYQRSELSVSLVALHWTALIKVAQMNRQLAHACQNELEMAGLVETKPAATAPVIIEAQRAMTSCNP